MHAASSVECRSPVATARCHPKLRPDKGRLSRFENSRHSTFTPTTNTSVQDLPNRNDATGGVGSTSSFCCSEKSAPCAKTSRF